MSCTSRACCVQGAAILIIFACSIVAATLITARARNDSYVSFETTTLLAASSVNSALGSMLNSVDIAAAVMDVGDNGTSCNYVADPTHMTPAAALGIQAVLIQLWDAFRESPFFWGRRLRACLRFPIVLPAMHHLTPLPRPFPASIFELSWDAPFAASQSGAILGVLNNIYGYTGNFTERVPDTYDFIPLQGDPPYYLTPMVTGAHGNGRSSWSTLGWDLSSDPDLVPAIDASLATNSMMLTGPTESPKNKSTGFPNPIALVAFSPMLVPSGTFEGLLTVGDLIPNVTTNFSSYQYVGQIKVTIDLPTLLLAALSSVSNSIDLAVLSDVTNDVGDSLDLSITCQGSDLFRSSVSNVGCLKKYPFAYDATNCLSAVGQSDLVANAPEASSSTLVINTVLSCTTASSIYRSIAWRDSNFAQAYYFVTGGRVLTVSFAADASAVLKNWVYLSDVVWPMSLMNALLVSVLCFSVAFWVSLPAQRAAQTAKEQAMVAEAARESHEFTTALLAHELRNAAHVVSASAELLYESLPDEYQTTEAREDCQSIISATQGMHRVRFEGWGGECCVWIHRTSGGFHRDTLFTPPPPPLPDFHRHYGSLRAPVWQAENGARNGGRPAARPYVGPGAPPVCGGAHSFHHPPRGSAPPLRRQHPHPASARKRAHQRVQVHP